MNRRDFLKGLLASAAVAASPSIIMASNLSHLPKATPATIADGKWHHIIYTVDDGLVEFYLDDVRMLPTEDLVDKYVRFEDGKVCFGNLQCSLKGGMSKRTVSFHVKDDDTVSDLEKPRTSEWFNGSMDSLKVWDTKLSPDQISLLNKENR